MNGNDQEEEDKMKMETLRKEKQICVQKFEPLLTSLVFFLLNIYNDSFDGSTRLRPRWLKKKG